jgi:aldose 1-epimerase
MMIGTRTVAALDALTIASADGELEAAVVPGAGMVGCSLRHRAAELLGLRRGLEAYVAEGSTMGIPLLYPWANRLSRDLLEVGGRAIDVTRPGLRLERDDNGLAIHGLLAAHGGWRVAEHRASDAGGVIAAELDFAADTALATAFPFPHRVVHRAELAERTLAVELTVEPTADVPVPVAFGFHPYLSLPGMPRSEWVLEAPLERRLALDSRGLPTGEREPTGAVSGPLGERDLDDAFEAPPGGTPFALSGGGRRIELAFTAGYPYAQLYAPPGDALIAIEPMTAPTDALVTGDGLRFAEAGDPFRARFEITVAEDG